MQYGIDNAQLFYEYYQQWIEVYKKGAIREATMAKYRMTQKWVKQLAPEMKVSDLTRNAYQKLLNDYAKEHERQTTLDFHHQLKGAILKSKGKYTIFQYNDDSIQFVTSSRLERYTSILEWDHGYLVVMAKYKNIGEIEEYIDLRSILDKMCYDTDKFLEPIKMVKIDYTD